MPCRIVGSSAVAMRPSENQDRWMRMGKKSVLLVCVFVFLMFLSNVTAYTEGVAAQ